MAEERRGRPTIIFEDVINEWQGGVGDLQLLAVVPAAAVMGEPMEYTPVELLRQGIQEMALSRINEVGRPAGIFRGLRAVEAKIDGASLIIRCDSLAAPLAIPLNAVMTFGDERITAENYARRAIERDDLLDVVLLPQVNGIFPMVYYWIRIAYADRPLDPHSYAKKDDGLFAMRAKSGEKAERIVARYLRDNGGIFTQSVHENPPVISRFGMLEKRKGSPIVPTGDARFVASPSKSRSVTRINGSGCRTARGVHSSRRMLRKDGMHSYSRT